MKSSAELPWNCWLVLVSGATCDTESANAAFQYKTRSQAENYRGFDSTEGGSEIRVRNEVLAASWFATSTLRSRGIEGDILKAVDQALRVLARLPREQP
jgi:hypothetical protein